jgi:hypothetical protein
MVAASASAIFIDIDFPLSPKRIVKIHAKPVIAACPDILNRAC